LKRHHHAIAHVGSANERVDPNVKALRTIENAGSHGDSFL
jgi:hypothetical protein